MCKNKLHVCTYSSVRFTLRFVNLFVEVSRVCGVGVFKSCVYPSRKWSSNYGNQRTIELSPRHQLSADKGYRFFLGIVNGCRIRIGIPVGNAVGIAFIYQVSYSELHPRGPNFVYHTNFFPLSSSFLGQNAKLHPLHSSF